MSANGLVNALVHTEGLAIEGNTSDYSSSADSGNTIRRRFCPQCGTHLFANSSARPQFTVVRVGTLDEPSSVQPSMNIWANSAPSWACLDQALECIDKQPAPPQTTPHN